MTSPKPSRKLEAKAVAAPVGGGFGGVLTVFLLWWFGIAFWGAPSDAAHATASIAAVPLPVSGLVTAVVPAALALAATYLAPHTHRPDLTGETSATHLDERIATPLEHMDATLTEVQAAIADQDARMQHTGPIDRVPDNVGLRIMDEAHD